MRQNANQKSEQATQNHNIAYKQINVGIIFFGDLYMRFSNKDRFWYMVAYRLNLVNEVSVPDLTEIQEA